LYGGGCVVARPHRGERLVSLQARLIVTEDALLKRVMTVAVLLEVISIGAV
jgi:hypothetical protein